MPLPTPQQLLPVIPLRPGKVIQTDAGTRKVYYASDQKNSYQLQWGLLSRSALEVIRGYWETHGTTGVFYWRHPLEMTDYATCFTDAPRLEWRQGMTGSGSARIRVLYPVVLGYYWIRTGKYTIAPNNQADVSNTDGWWELNESNELIPRENQVGIDPYWELSDGMLIPKELN